VSVGGGVVLCVVFGKGGGSWGGGGGVGGGGGKVFDIPSFACHEDLAHSILLEQLDDFRAWCSGWHGDSSRDLQIADALIPPPALNRTTCSSQYRQIMRGTVAVKYSMLVSMVD